MAHDLKELISAPIIDERIAGQTNEIEDIDSNTLRNQYKLSKIIRHNLDTRYRTFLVKWST